MKDSSEETITSLKNQLEEAKKIEKSLKTQLKEREDSCCSLESKIVGLRKKLDESTTKMKFEKSSTIIDEIISYQRSPPNKIVIGYNEEKEVFEEQ